MYNQKLPPSKEINFLKNKQADPKQFLFVALLGGLGAHCNPHMRGKAELSHPLLDSQTRLNVLGWICVTRRLGSVVKKPDICKILWTASPLLHVCEELLQCLTWMLFYALSQPTLACLSRRETVLGHSRKDLWSPHYTWEWICSSLTSVNSLGILQQLIDAITMLLTVLLHFSLRHTFFPH